MYENAFSFNLDIGDARFTISKVVANQNVNSVDADTPLKFHAHGEYEIFFVEEDGIVFHTAEGKSEYPFSTVIVVPPEVIHYAVNYVATFYFSFEKKANSKEKYFDGFKEVFCSDKPIIFNGTSEYYWLWKEIKDCFSFSEQSDVIRIKAALQLFFIKILQFGKKANQNKSRMSDVSHLYRIDNIINTRYFEKLTVNSIANELFLSARQVSRIIRKHYGTTFPRLLAERRLEISAILLRDTDKSINSIMTSVGFESESNFFTLFKKRYGCTPMQYRIYKK